jgi:hypothetical protein
VDGMRLERVVYGLWGVAQVVKYSSARPCDQ